MTLTNEDVKKISKLAKLKFDAEQEDKMLNELNNIFQWIEQLNDVDIENIDAMTTPNILNMPEREDVIINPPARDKIFKNAPKSEDDFFAVPKVIE